MSSSAIRSGFLKTGNTLKRVGRKTDQINGQSNVLQPAANLLQRCLAESEVFGNSMRVFEKACFAKLCQSGTQVKGHTQTIIFRDLFVYLVPRDRIEPPSICESKGASELQKIQFHSFLDTTAMI